jgi:hypothetical protein
MPPAGNGFPQIGPACSKSIPAAHAIVFSLFFRMKKQVAYKTGRAIISRSLLIHRQRRRSKAALCSIFPNERKKET